MTRLPGHGSSAWIDANGTRFHCRVDGAPDAPWLVFSNSLMTNLSLWDDQVAVLGSSVRVLRYDQRGHGATAVPHQPCTFDLLADDVVALMNQFQIERATIVGVSMGGVTALRVATRHPERLTRVVACDAQWRAAPNATEVWEERITTAVEQGLSGLVEPTVRRWFTPEFVATNPPALDRVRRMIRYTPAAGFIACARALQRYDFREEVAAIRVPVLLLVGKSDGQLPDVMREMHEGIAGSRFVEIDDAGHLPNIDQAAAFNSAIAAFVRDSAFAGP